MKYSINILYKLMLILFTNSMTFSQSIKDLSFYPINVGDIRYLSSTPIQVAEKVLLNNKVYYKIKSGSQEWLERIDSLGNVYKANSYDNYVDKLFLKLTAKPNDNWTAKINGDVSVYFISDTATVYTNDTTFYNCRMYSFVGQETSEMSVVMWFAQNIGLVKQKNYSIDTEEILVKAFVNGSRIPNALAQLKLKSTVPKKGQTNIPINATIKIYPESNILPEFIKKENFKVYGRKKGFLDYSFKNASNLIEIIPNTNFEYDDEIAVTVDKNVADLMGEKLNEEYTFTFFTQIKSETKYFSQQAPLSKVIGGDFDIADYDGDGRKDILIFGQYYQGGTPQYNIEIYRNGINGFINVFSLTNYMDYSLPWNSCKFVDINNDGFLDAAIKDGEKIQFLINKNNKYEIGTSLQIRLGNMLFADVDEDGFQDLIVFEYTQPKYSFAIYINTNGTFTELSRIISQTTDCRILELYGSKKDEKIKIIKTSENISSTNIFNINSGALIKEEITLPFYYMGTPDYTLYLGYDHADIDNDSDDDFIIGNIILRREGNSFVADGNTIVKRKFPFGKFSDYNKDGYNDLFIVGALQDEVLRDRTYIEYYTNRKGNFYLTNRQNLEANLWVSAAKWTDINNDGLIDLAAITSKGLIVMLNNGILNSTKENAQIPSKCSLSQNYPNPFNPSTTIEYSIPKSEQVTLIVFDVLGREVATIVNEYKQAGAYKANFNASGLVSGVYYYQLRAGSFVETKKLIVLK